MRSRPFLEDSRLLAVTTALAMACGLYVSRPHGGIVVAMVGYALAQSLAAFTLFGWDKRLARTGGRRVSERNLLWLAGLGGALGAVLGMQVFRHKTRHARFRWLVPTALVAQVALTIGAAYFR